MSEFVRFSVHNSEIWVMHFFVEDIIDMNKCGVIIFIILILIPPFRVDADSGGYIVKIKNYFDGIDDVSDNIGHGTHVSGIIAAEMNSLGIVGTAPNVKIVPLKCFDSSLDTDADMLISAIYDAVDVYDCQIINMSWGLNADNDGDYKKLNGTSQATPMVSGLAAILLSMDDSKTIDDFKQLLSSTSEDLGTTGYDTKFGYGLINVDLFVENVLQNLSVYISPLCVEDDVSGVYYFNLTDKEHDLFRVEAYYDNQKMDYCNFENINLSKEESFFLKCENLTKDVKYMAWANFNSLVPLGKSRIIKNTK